MPLMGEKLQARKSPSNRLFGHMRASKVIGEHVLLRGSVVKSASK